MRETIREILYVLNRSFASYKSHIWLGKRPYQRSKIAGDPAMIELFSDIGIGQGLRYVVGTFEIAGAIGVLVPRLCGLAATGLALLMIGATIVNVAVLGVSPVFTLFLFALAAVTAWLRRHHLDPLRARG